MADKKPVTFEDVGLKHTPMEYVDGFLNSYFEQAKAVVEFEKEFVKSNGLEGTKIDYFKLRRFVNTAIARFQEIDQKFLSDLLQKLYKDVDSLFDFAKELRSKTNLVDMVFYNEFLKSITEFVNLENKLEDLSAQRGKFEQDCAAIEEKIKTLEKQLYIPEIRVEHKKLKLLLGDAAHHFATARQEYDDTLEKISLIKKSLYSIFTTRFKATRDSYIVSLMACANTKAFYLDKLLWKKAQKSPAVSNYILTSRIEGNYDLKTFIKYYLKNINAESAADRDWHMYLVNVMKLL